MMFTLYGKKYAKNDREAVASLFQADGTVNGFYKRTSGGLVLLDLQKTARAFVRADGFGPVSVGQHKGKIRYAYALSSPDAAWLGVPENYAEAKQGAKAAALEGAE